MVDVRKCYLHSKIIINAECPQSVMPLKILYATTEDASDQNAWSGLVYNIRRTLGEAGLQIELFDRVPFECPLPLRLLHQLYKHGSSKVHQLQIEPAVLKIAARRIEQRFLETRCDAVFCPGTGVPIHAFVNPSIPVFSYLDATKKAWIDTYFGLESLCERSRKMVGVVDCHGIANNTLTFFSSYWARHKALEEDESLAERLMVVPFGANLTTPPTKHEVTHFINTRHPCECRLLFLGKEWERKGGTDALAILKGLRSLGVHAWIDVVGCFPEIPPELEPWVRVHGFIDRSTEKGKQQFNSVLAAAHFLLFFSQAEAYGLALCEANAFGVPCLATQVGGIPTIIQNGKNGYLFDPLADATACIKLIQELMENHEKYCALAFGSRNEFDLRLNWQVSGAELRRHILRKLGKHA